MKGVLWLWRRVRAPWPHAPVAILCRRTCCASDFDQVLVLTPKCLTQDTKCAWPRLHFRPAVHGHTDKEAKFILYLANMAIMTAGAVWESNAICTIRCALGVRQGPRYGTTFTQPFVFWLFVLSGGVKKCENKKLPLLTFLTTHSLTC